MDATRYYGTQEPTDDFTFIQREETFFVEEQSDTRYSGKRGFAVAKVSKTNLGTWQMLEQVAAAADIPLHQIGYAGLKDKNATAIQYVSVPLAYEKALKQLKLANVSILQTWRHHERIAIGQLAGNRFRIILHNVSPKAAERLKQSIARLEKEGFPNYFGDQRFGMDENNFETARQIAHGEKTPHAKQTERFLCGLYQSTFFNAWLAERLRLHTMIRDAADAASLSRILGLNERDAAALMRQALPLTLLDGELMLGSEGKIFRPLKLNKAVTLFKERAALPTGLMCGRQARRAEAMAGIVEQRFDDPLARMKGQRRAAWVFPKIIALSHEQTHFTLEFTLPKSSYATVLVEALRYR